MTSPVAPRESADEIAEVIHRHTRFDERVPAVCWTCWSDEQPYEWPCDAGRLSAELARVQGELRGAEKQIEGFEKQIERLTQELEPLRIRQRRMDIQELRVLIGGYQGTCFPLNRTSLHGLFDEIERLGQALAALRGAVRRVAEPVRALVEAHPKTHKMRHWWQYEPCKHALYGKIRDALARLDAALTLETATIEERAHGLLCQCEHARDEHNEAGTACEQCPCNGFDAAPAEAQG